MSGLNHHQPISLIIEDIQDLHHASRTGNSWQGLYHSKSPVFSLTIPSPSLFTTLNDARPDHFPTVAECAVHLELLQVFYTLRSNIIFSRALDKTFGTEAKPRTVYRKTWKSRERKYVHEPVKLGDTTWDSRRQEKWTTFLDYAAARFVTWARKTNEFLRTWYIEESVDASGKKQELTLQHTPPLDILMVWHALLLNPTTYRSYCKKNNLESLLKVPFPWARIHEAINTSIWAYEPPASSENWIKKQVKIQPDLYKFFVKLSEPAAVKEFSLTDHVKLPIAQTPTAHTLPIQPTQKPQNKFLIDNVQRQAKFVDKMYAHLWISSPSAQGTITRAVERYENFLQLFKLYPGKMLVPTLDVDIVWHTHQLSAVEYGQSMHSRCGRFIDHDDKIAQNSLNDGMAETTELYRVRFGGTYSVCLCWDCEALLDALEACDEDEGLESVTAGELAVKVKGLIEKYKIAEEQRRRWFNNIVRRP